MAVSYEYAQISIEAHRKESLGRHSDTKAKRNIELTIHLHLSKMYSRHKCTSRPTTEA